MKMPQIEFCSILWNNVFVTLNQEKVMVDIHLSFNALKEPDRSKVFYDQITMNGYHPRIYYNLESSDEVGYSITYPIELGGEGFVYSRNSAIGGIEAIQRYLSMKIPKRIIVEKTNGNVIGKPIKVTVEEGCLLP